MQRVTKIFHQTKEIILIDYSNCREEEMINIVTDAKDMILIGNKPCLLVSIFCNNYVTRKFMMHLEAELKAAEHLIKKNTITGISETQKWILKGVNLWYKKKIYDFSTLTEALDFLVTEDSTIL